MGTSGPIRTRDHAPGHRALMQRSVMALAAVVLMAAMLPGITLSATVGDPGLAVAAASVESSPSAVAPAKKKHHRKHHRQPIGCGATSAVASLRPAC